MLFNWYAVYTLPNREKKLAALLSKKGIENFCPLNYTINLEANKRISNETLLRSFIFVRITEAQIRTVKNIQGVLNLIYWKCSPAIIPQKEIEALKKISSNYQNIRVDKCSVQPDKEVQINEELIFAHNELDETVKHQIIKIVLPALGYVLSGARVRQHERFIKDMPVGQNTILRKRITAFFTI